MGLKPPKLTHSLITVFSVFLVIISLSVILINYQKGGELAHQSVERSIAQSAKNIAQQIAEFNNHLLHLCTIGSRMIKDTPLEDVNDQWMRFAYDEVVFNPAITDIYAANSRGSFIGATEKPTIFTRRIDRRTEPPIEITTTRDRHFNAQSTEEKTGQDIEFDPRKRPWFIEGIKANQYHVTDPYLFYADQSIGITYTCPITDTAQQKVGVMGMDLTLDNVQAMLRDPHLKPTPNSVIFIFHENGKVIGHSEQDVVHKNPDQTIHLLELHELQSWVIDSYQTYLRDNQTITSTTTDSVSYKAIYLPLDQQFADHYHVGVIVPENDFLAPLDEIRDYAMIFSGLILLLALLLLGYLVKKISTPILEVCQVAEHIRDFRLDTSVINQSFYREIFELQQALFHMQAGLRSFQKYLPSDLVRELVSMGKEAEVGGKSHYVVVMFTDIQDFTQYSEKIPAAKIAAQLNEYFDILGQNIVESDGIIDKYIGDAVMAIWNIPKTIVNPEAKAAHCALKIQEDLQKANQKWEAKGRPPFFTRIGIHAGEAIVGNLGASFRINYTAIGDVINVTSRLEGANKELGSSILISHTIYDKIKDSFACKKHGLINLKGRSDAIQGYEVIKEMEKA